MQFERAEHRFRCRCKADQKEPKNENTIAHAMSEYVLDTQFAASDTCTWSIKLRKFFCLLVNALWLMKWQTTNVKPQHAVREADSCSAA